MPSALDYIHNVRDLAFGSPSPKTVFFALSGDFEAAGLHLASTVGEIMRLRGHLCPDPNDRAFGDGRVAIYVRNSFWLSYTIDILLAWRTNNPPLYNNDVCDLTLPPYYDEITYSEDRLVGFRPEGKKSYHFPLPAFPGNLRLAIIQAIAFVKLHSTSAMRKTDVELLRDIRRMDDMLHSWRDTVPLQYRPTWSSEDLSSPINENQPMLKIILNLMFHQTITIIHRTVGRCKAWTDPNPQGNNCLAISALRSSLTLAVASCRSSALYLRWCNHMLPMDCCFWLLIIFPLTSFFMIFCNILLEPLAPSAKTDLLLLECLANVVRCRFLRDASDTGKVHAVVVNDFTDDLIRLGRTAIVNAERGLTRECNECMIKHVPQIVVPSDLVDSTHWMLDLI